MTSPATLYAEIELTQNQVAKVSFWRFEELNRFPWSARWSKRTRSYYALRSGKTAEGYRYTVLMHRQILGLGYGDPRQGDHKNHDTLDNTDDNLQVASPAENSYNRRKHCTSNNPYKGVSFHKATGKWQAQIQVHGKKIFLGIFETAELAYAAYCKAAEQYFGAFACVG